MVTINKVLMVNMFQKIVTIILEVQKALLWYCGNIFKFCKKINKIDLLKLETHKKTIEWIVEPVKNIYMHKFKSP